MSSAPRQQRMARRFTSALAGVALLVAACGVSEDAAPRPLPTVAPTPTETPAPSAPSVTVTIYLLDANGNVAPVERVLGTTEVRTSDLIAELTKDTSPDETAEGLTTAVPSELNAFSAPTIANGRVRLDFVSGGLDELEGLLLRSALAQIVWTLTSVQEIDRVVINIDGAQKQWPTGDGAEARVLRRSQYEAFDPLAADAEATPGPDGEASPGATATPG